MRVAAKCPGCGFDRPVLVRKVYAPRDAGGTAFVDPDEATALDQVARVLCEVCKANAAADVHVAAAMRMREKAGALLERRKRAAARRGGQ